MIKEKKQCPQPFHFHHHRHHPNRVINYWNDLPSAVVSAPPWTALKED
jgi:hypothetical protein